MNLDRRVLRRYAPLLVVVAVQALFVAVLPSTAGNQTTVAATDTDFQSPFADQGGVASGSGGTSDGGLTTTDDAPTGNGTSGTSGSTASGGTGTGGSTSGTAGSSGSSGSGGSGSAGTPSGDGGGAAPATNDTSHCVQGRQWDPAIDFFAPPCIPKFTGANPGATYPGVTADTVRVVSYIGQENPAVQASLAAQGLAVSPAQREQFIAAIEDFANSRYEFYGRELEIVIYEGQCSTIPPDNACLRQEMRRIQADVDPFGFIWISPLTNAPFDELSNIGIVNLGGQMFMDSFSQARRPHHWDVHMSGTEIAKHFGEWWCKQLSGKPAAYSPSPSLEGTPGNTNGRERVLGIIGTNDIENVKMREKVDEILQGCGDKVEHVYDASNDLSTAAAQRSASVASMRQNPEATTVLCLCNPVGAQFVYSEMQTQNYYPEIVYAGTVYTDLDDIGQTNMEGAGCPSESNCNFELAFGLSSSEPREPVGEDRAARMWRATGRDGNPPYPGAELEWDYWQLMLSLIQNAGPDLKPTTLEAGAHAAGLRGGGSTGHALRGFEPGIYSWNRDMALSFWDPDDASPFNGEAGTFKLLGRVQLGGYANALPSIPTSRR